MYLSSDAAVVLDSSGKVVTTWSKAEFGSNVLKILSDAGF